MRRFVEAVDDGVGTARVRHGGQHSHAELQPAQRGDGQGLVGFGRQTGQPLTYDIEDTFGQVEVVERTNERPATTVLHQDAALDEVPEHLVGEEGVAVGALDERRREGAEVVVQLVARLGRQQRLDTLIVEPAERQAFDARTAVHVG